MIGLGLPRDVPATKPVTIIGLGLILMAALSSAFGSSSTIEFRIYEGDSLYVGDYELVYWHGDAIFPSRLNVYQTMGKTRVLMESWRLNASHHSLQRHGQTIFNFTLHSEDLDEVGEYYAVGEVSAGWDVAGIVDAEWLDLHSSGEPASFSLTVRNPAGQPFAFEFEVPSPSEELDTVLYSGGIEVAGPWHAGAMASLSLKLTAAPSEQASSGEYPLSLQMEGQLDVPSAGPVSHIFRVESSVDLSLQLHRDVETGDAPRFTIAYPMKVAEAGEPVEFEADLKNELESETAFVATVSLPEGIADGSTLTIGGQPTSLAVLQPGEQMKIKLIVETSPVAAAGIYQILLAVKYGDSQLSDAFQLEITSDEPTYMPEIEITTTESAVEAGEQVRYAFAVENSGKVEDTILLGFQGPANWESTFTTAKGGAVTSVTLEPGQREELTLTIDPPVGFSGEKAVLLTARSTGSGSVEVALQLEVLPPGVPTLSTTSSEKQAEPGESVRFDLLLHNPGPDQLTIAPMAELLGSLPLEAEISVDGETGSRFNVDAGKTAKIGLTIKVDQDARGQYCTWTIRVPYSSDWRDDAALEFELAMLIEDPVEDVILSTSYPTGKIEAGERAEFDAKLQSQLMTETTFQVDYDIPGEMLCTATLTVNGKETEMVTLEPGASANVKLSIETLPECQSDVYDLALESSWTGSDGQSSIENLVLGLTVTDDEPLHSLDIDTQISHLFVAAGQEACFVCTLANNGKLEEECELDLVLPEGWGSSLKIGGSSAVAITLSPGEKRDISVCLIPPSDESGTHAIDLVAASGQALGEGHLVLEVGESEPPEFSCFYPEKTSETGDSLQFDVDLRNPANQPVEFWLQVDSVKAVPGTCEITVDDEKASHFILEGGRTSKIRVSVDTNTDAPTGEYDLDLTARYSYQDEEAAGESGTASISLKMILEETTAEYSLEAYADYPSQTIVAGEQARFALTLKNEGKIQDTYALSANVSASWNARFSAGTSVVRTVQLEPGASAKPTLTLTSPLTETGEVTIAILIESQSTGEIETVPVQLIMEPSPDLEIVLENLYLDSKAGRETSLSIDVRNPGNTVLTNVQLLVDAPEEWGAEYSPLKITEMSPGDRETITLLLTSPGTTPRGDYSVSVGAQSDQVETEDITLRVSVKRGGATGYASLLVIFVVFAGLIYFFRRFGRR